MVGMTTFQQRASRPSSSSLRPRMTDKWNSGPRYAASACGRVSWKHAKKLRCLAENFKGKREGFEVGRAREGDGGKEGGRESSIMGRRYLWHRPDTCRPTLTGQHEE